MRNGPELWTEILMQVRRVFPNAVIAGGAVRDYLLGLEPKDIDVFVYVQRMADLELMSEELGSDFWLEALDHSESYDAAENDFGREVIGVMDGAYCGDINVQIIARRFAGPRDLVELFDLNICKCWFDGEQIHDTEEARHDRENLTLTLARWDTEEAVKRSAERAARFRNRHPEMGWRYVDPNFLTAEVAA